MWKPGDPLYQRPSFFVSTDPQINRPMIELEYDVPEYPASECAICEPDGGVYGKGGPGIVWPQPVRSRCAMSDIYEVAHILPPVCQHLSTWFDRTLCAEPCGSMHVRCYRCGLPVDDCVFLTEEGEH